MSSINGRLKFVWSNGVSKFLERGKRLSEEKIREIR